MYLNAVRSCFFHLIGEMRECICRLISTVDYDGKVVIWMHDCKFPFPLILPPFHGDEV